MLITPDAFVDLKNVHELRSTRRIPVQEQDRTSAGCYLPADLCLDLVGFDAVVVRVRSSRTGIEYAVERSSFDECLLHGALRVTDR